MNYTKAKVADDAEYLYVIKGVIPEVMATVAYRHANKCELITRKIIKCPYCKERLTDVERHTSVQLYGIPKGKRKKPIPGQFIKKCTSCKGDVGIVIV